jgi:hypothetical protein
MIRRNLAERLEEEILPGEENRTDVKVSIWFGTATWEVGPMLNYARPPAPTE